MKRLLIFTLLIVIMGVAAPVVYSQQSSGAVFGTWDAGTTVVLDGPTYIPADKSLVIQPGVRVLVKTISPLVVLGNLQILGDAFNPVLITPDENWRGIQFEAAGEVVRRMHWVVIPPDAGEPAVAVSGSNSYLEIQNCDLRAKEHCLVWRGGRLWADNNSFLSTKLFCKTVSIVNLFNEFPCGSDNANRLNNNLIQAFVPMDSGSTWSQFSAGLAVEGSTNLCIYDNSIIVEAPIEAIGAYFTGPVNQGQQTSKLNYCTVAVHGLSGGVKGILRANGGRLSVTRCRVDVSNNDTNSRYTPTGILASQQAQVVVNSSDVVLTHGGVIFCAATGSRIEVDYAVLWIGASNLHSGIDPAGEINTSELEVQSVVYGQHISWADPRWQRHGTWGLWNSASDVRQYYSVQWPSPCIDTGDSLLGRDPDGTLPDIGPYYYDQSAQATPDEPASLPLDLVLAPPYPNPFNAIATIPLLLNKSGHIEMVVFDVLGREVINLTSGIRPAGRAQGVL